MEQLVQQIQTFKQPERDLTPYEAMVLAQKEEGALMERSAGQLHEHIYHGATDDFDQIIDWVALRASEGYSSILLEFHPSCINDPEDSNYVISLMLSCQDADRHRKYHMASWITTRGPHLHNDEFRLRQVMHACGIAPFDEYCTMLETDPEDPDQLDSRSTDD
ncbi:MAG: hypothetical protein TR69_WS6001000024 [candidate division WS6 bacterium OLB20]|uniref:Uncharacterized protein n=1 Tax=candidate division WS6 bacterium OLB20 TaxID=1617426 RepID=A0A136M106_9BACT|nr:MAG: hypothetical protein TR69_WS6001000024 [candidate division WS6 bacterium OLB20]